MKRPRLGGRVRGLFSRSKCYVERVHQFDPAECEGEEGGRRLCQADRLIEPALPVETIEQPERRVYLDADQLRVNRVAPRHSTEQPDHSLRYVRSL